MKRYTVEMCLTRNNAETFIEVPATVGGAPFTYDPAEAETALNFWDNEYPDTRFRVVEWTPKVVEF